MRGESAFRIRADDWRRLRDGPPDGASDYLALFLNTFQRSKAAETIGWIKTALTGGSAPAMEQPLEVSFETDCVAKLDRSRLQGLSVSFGRPLW